MPSNIQDAWDEISVNPHESALEAGRQEGREAGLQAGFNDGFALGRTKGIEFGMELGFIRGFLNTVECKLQSRKDYAARNERLQKKVDDLRRAIDDFPSPDVMFAYTLNHDVRNSNIEDDSETVAVPDGTDILGSMQRIRAKLKVLTTQLKIPQFSLKQVMEDAARMENAIDVSKTGEPNSITDKSQDMSSEW